MENKGKLPTVGKFRFDSLCDLCECRYSIQFTFPNNMGLKEFLIIWRLACISKIAQGTILTLFKRIILRPSGMHRPSYRPLPLSGSLTKDMLKFANKKGI